MNDVNLFALLCILGSLGYLSWSVVRVFKREPQVALDVPTLSYTDANTFHRTNTGSNGHRDNDGSGGSDAGNSRPRTIYRSDVGVRAGSAAPGSNNGRPDAEAMK